MLGVDGKKVFANLVEHGDFVAADAAMADEASKLLNVAIQAAEIKAGKVAQLSVGSQEAVRPATGFVSMGGYRAAGTTRAATTTTTEVPVEQKAAVKNTEGTLPQGPDVNLTAGLDITPKHKA